MVQAWERWPFVSGGTVAEDGGPDADQRCAVGDGHFEIAGHSHRQLGKPVPRGAVGKPGKVRRRIGLGWRDAHQADHGRAEAGLAGVDEGVGLGAGDAAFLRFLPGIDLNEQARRAALTAGGVGDRVGQTLTVEGFDHIGDAHGVRRLVGLQRADDVQPEGRVRGSKRRELLRGFLDAIFAKQRLPGIERRENGGGRMELGDSDEADAAGRPAGTSRRRCNAGANVGQVRGDGGVVGWGGGVRHGCQTCRLGA